MVTQQMIAFDYMTFVVVRISHFLLIDIWMAPNEDKYLHNKCYIFPVTAISNINSIISLD